MDSKLIIIGAGGHAGSVIDACEKQGVYTIHGLVDDTKVAESRVHGYKVLGGIPYLFNMTSFDRDRFHYFIAIGDNYSRFKIFMRLHELKLKYATIIHPTATIGRFVYINPGVCCMAGVTINTGSKIEKQVILNTHCSIDHDTLVEDFASIGPGAITGGNVIIGHGSAICIGAVLINNITVGNNTVIGAGSVVTSDQPDNIVAYGVPCKQVRKHENGDRYL